MLEQKMGWLRQYRSSINDWSRMLDAAGITLKYIRNHGYHAQAHEELASLLGGFDGGPVAAMVAEVLEFVAAQTSLCGERSFPGSTEVLESLIGKGKQQMGRNTNGYTKTVLGMAAAVVEVSKAAIETALQTVKVRELQSWIQEKLGMSLQAQRQRALPSLVSGTKTG
jgi:hypothetical protein